MTFLFVHSWQGFSLAEWYLRSALEERFPGEVNFHSLDLPSNEIPANDLLPRSLFSHRPSLIGFSCFYWNIRYFEEVTRWIKKLFPEVKIVFGGPQVRSEKAATGILLGNESVDFIIRGEGEKALCGLMMELVKKSRQTFESIPNLSYRGEGSIRHNRESGPLSSRGLIFHSKNSILADTISNLDEVSYETVKGCYEKCSYCYYPTSRYAILDDALVLAELSFLCNQPLKDLRICDTHFGGSRERAKKLFRHLAELNKGIQVRIYPDLHHVDTEYMDLVKASGSLITSIGIQTTNMNVLNRINRKPIHHLADRIGVILKAFPNVPADLIIGLPGDSLSGVEKTFHDVLKLGFTRINLFRLMLFPGTEMYERQTDYFNNEQLIVSPSGQVITSSDFPPEVQPDLACLIEEITDKVEVH